MGCAATNGQKALVFSMIICDTSQGSTRELSVYTRIPLHPASSLHLATSMTWRRYDCLSTWLDCGQVENTSRSVSGARSWKSLFITFSIIGEGLIWGIALRGDAFREYWPYMTTSAPHKFRDGTAIRFP